MKTTINNTIGKIVIFSLLPLIFAACSRPVVVVEEIPKNTPHGSRIFITGDFNRWDPGDQRFTMELNSDSQYIAKLPSGFGNVSFKFTRGDWTTVETDICGYDINNRSFNYGSTDTVFLKIESWQDLDAINCPEVTVVLDKLPDNTPEDEPIAIAGDFNEWLPDSSAFMKQDTQSGRYYLKIPRMSEKRKIEFLVTRGNLLTAETDKYGNEPEKREITFGTEDTVFIEVENWQDIQEEEFDGVTIILEEIPEEYPNDKIFITGSFNGWYPRDSRYMFRKNAEGKYEIKLPRESDEIEYKITRGDWSKEEVDVLGYRKSNSRFKFGSVDTLRININGWLDRTDQKQPSFVLVVDSVPETTPGNADLYMANSMKSWRAGSYKYRFTKSPKGFYFLNLKDIWRSFEYKITLGDWDYQELDENGHIIPNREYVYDGKDTVKISVKNWMGYPPDDQDTVTIILDDIPEYTPDDYYIYIAGTFNDWDPGNTDYILKENKKGKYYIKIPEYNDEIEFKFTLGSWDYEEQNEYHHNIPNRVYRFGYADTLRLSIPNWKGIWHEGGQVIIKK